MANNSRRKRHRILALIAAGAMRLSSRCRRGGVDLIRQPDKSEPPSRPCVPPTAPTTPGEAAAGVPGRQLPRRAADVDPRHLGVVAAARPAQPDAVPNRVAAQRTNPIREQFGAARMQTYTVPYTAQFHNPLSADGQMSYNDSRAEGTGPQWMR